MGGCIIGLPLTSGPVSLLLALSHGPSFAIAAAVGTLSASLSQVAFSLAYVYVCCRAGWRASLVVGVAAFAGSTAVLQPVRLDAIQTLLVVIAGMAVALLLMPGGAQSSSKNVAAPAWDLPARMVAATSLVLLLTGLAPALGARLTGLIAPFPVYGSILAAFTHAQRGRLATQSLLRGFMLGLSGTVGFYFVLAETLHAVPLAVAFCLALATALVLQAASLATLHRMRLHHLASRPVVAG